MKLVFLKQNLEGFLTAWQFLTIIPLPGKGWRRSLIYFPVVGLVLGLMLWGLDYGLGLVLPEVLVNALLILSLIIITGALHLDGFIDTCDGVFAMRSSPRARLEIMADSRVGSFGVIGVLSLLLTKYASLAALPSSLRVSALLLMPVLSRWTMVYAILAFPSARKEGLGQAFKQQANWQGMAIATVIALAIAAALLKLTGVAAMTSLCLVTFGVATYLRSKLGGLNGDTYGAINELAEVLTLILLPLISLGIEEINPGLGEPAFGLNCFW